MGDAHLVTFYSGVYAIVSIKFLAYAHGTEVVVADESGKFNVHFPTTQQTSFMENVFSLKKKGIIRPIIVLRDLKTVKRNQIAVCTYRTIYDFADGIGLMHLQMDVDCYEEVESENGGIRRNTY